MSDPTPTATPTAPTETDLRALQTVLAAEHAAVYVHGVLGARTSESAQAALFDSVRSAYVAHRDRRDVLVGLLAGAGQTPTPAAVAYVAPADLSTPEAITAAALQVESACAATYAEAVGRTVGATRRAAIGWLDEAAVRELAFGGAPQALPGTTA